MANKNRRSVTKKQKASKATSIIHQEQSISGPIPSPDIFHQYDQVLNGAAERILAMAEKDSQHIRDMEADALRATKRDNLLGPLLAFLSIIIFMASASYALFLGFPWVASTIAGTTILGVVTAFLKTRK